MFSTINIGAILVCVFATCAHGESKYTSLCSGNTEEMKLVVVPNEGCILFVTCRKEEVHGPLQCPPKTLFSAELMYCDDANNVTCADVSDRLLDTPKCQMKAVAGSCNNFTQCAHGKVLNMNCGEGLMFSNSKLVCDNPWDLIPEEKEYCNVDV
ncbi:uncharacterized protein LOC124136993 [Haliotis rufescens]|uniref:uncharacterized protein LOC124136993 n=1 Tax=Haliotis rufescens TaxID=6454 RepID=UPI001EAFDAE1|nr:uncharacterized protein LOC124136993 [Haliotis rufescens]